MIVPVCLRTTGPEARRRLTDTGPQRAVTPGIMYLRLLLNEETHIALAKEKRASSPEYFLTMKSIIMMTIGVW